MEKDYLAQTIRIALEPTERRHRPPTVVFRPPVASDRPYDSCMTDGEKCSEYDRLLQCIYDAVLITDSRGMVLECNQRAIDFLGYSEEEIQGSGVSQFVCGIDKEVMGHIRRNLSEHRYTLIEGVCQRKDGSVFPAEIAVNRLDLSLDGRLTFFVRNISVRKRAQEALEAAVAEVELRDRQRSQFISNVSHELRTPLTSMMYAITNMLKGVAGPLAPEVKEYLSMLLGDSKRMLATVNDILDLRKIESNTLKLVKTRVPYGRLVRRSVESLRVQALQKSIDIQVDAGDRLWFADCDAQKIERVVINLVGNAIKFTPEGGRISVSVTDDALRSGFVRVSVDDDGIGIPPEYIEHVTERYYTVGDQPSGSGLGLAISKEIVAMHGGELSVESPVPGADRGTRISFTMPVSPPPLVMIIAGDDVADELHKQIGSYGYGVVAQGDYDSPADAVIARKPDIVIIDLDFPGGRSRDVIMNLKSNPESARVPVLVMTGVVLDGTLSDILRNFAIPVITKPWDQSELLDGIANSFLGRMPFI